MCVDPFNLDHNLAQAVSTKSMGTNTYTHTHTHTHTISSLATHSPALSLSSVILAEVRLVVVTRIIYSKLEQLLQSVT